MKSVKCIFPFLLVLISSLPLSATTFYVESGHGDDTAAGSRRHPWKTLDAVNRHHFQPGDRILFHAGSHWHGQLRITHSGSADMPIQVDRYGRGSLPRIDGDGTVREVVSLFNVSGVEVRHLEITNHGQMASLVRGVLVEAKDSGTLHDIVISDLYIHDVNGTEQKKDSGGIIFQTSGQERPSRFDGLRIERNLLWKVDRSAIAGLSDEVDRTRWFPSLHVVLRDNVADDIGGDGIVPWATAGAVVEHNIVFHANQRAQSYNAGIWPWSTDNTTLLWNEAAWTHSTLDGEGFDSDYNSRNTRFFFNYSHDNDGGFMLLCSPVRRDEQNNVGNTGTVVEYNISRNDHSRIFHLSGASDVTVEHNVIYTAPDEEVQILLVSQWDGWSTGARFRSNLFQAAGVGRYGHEAERRPDGSYRITEGWGGARDIVFQCNRYLGTHVDRPIDSCPETGAAVAAAHLDWNEPAIDPAHPERLGVFIKRHRRWMENLFRKQFGRLPRVEPDRASRMR